MGSEKERFHSDSEWLEILRNNQGFTQPHKWIAYAREHGFKKVSATRIHVCPDCADVKATTVGQYVYYSTLISLRACGACGLLYSDTRISPDVIERHFEQTYSGETYFEVRRKDIFDQIVGEVAAHAPIGGAILDVGGAKGHLMALLKKRRPDLRITVNDLSMSKCAWAESRYGFRTICGSAADLAVCSGRFDVITAIDVLYYEADISRLWSALALLLKPQGMLVLRLPNNRIPVVVSQLALKAMTRSHVRAMRTVIRYFNPEHLYVFSRRYLKRRLTALGFMSVRVLPSALLLPEAGSGASARLYHGIAKAISAASAGRVVITPGMMIMGSMRSRNETGAGD